MSVFKDLRGIPFNPIKNLKENAQIAKEAVVRAIEESDYLLVPEKGYVIVVQIPVFPRRQGGRPFVYKPSKEKGYTANVNSPMYMEFELNNDFLPTGYKISGIIIPDSAAKENKEEVFLKSDFDDMDNAFLIVASSDPDKVNKLAVCNNMNKPRYQFLKNIPLIVMSEEQIMFYLKEK